MAPQPQQRINKLQDHLKSPVALPALFHPSKSTCKASYDYIVVGAGSSGCAMAARLAEKFPLKTVLLVDAGGDNRQFRVRSPCITCPDLQNSDLDFAYRTTPQPMQQNRPAFWPRGKVLGGSSSINYMLAVRGDSRGYDKWANELGCPGWDYASVEPYFRKLECYTGKDRGVVRGRQGPVKITDNRDIAAYKTQPIVDAFIRGCNDVGVPQVADYNAADQIAGGVVCASQCTIDNGQRADTATAYLFGEQGAFARCPNLHCLTNHQCARVLFEGDVAVAVEFIGGVVVRATKEVVLCAGAVGSPQILLLSGVGPKAHLESKGVRMVRDLPGVGQGMKDHVLIPLHYTIKESCETKFAPDNVMELGRELVNLFAFNQGVLTTSWVQTMAFLNASPQVQGPADAHAIQIHVMPFGSTDEAVSVRNLGYDRSKFTFPDPKLLRPHHIVFLPSLLQPKSVGYVELATNNPSDHPVIEPNYLAHPDDVQALLEGWNFTKRVAEGQAMSAIVDGLHADDTLTTNGVSAQSDAYAVAKIKRDLITIYHPCCTCKMGPDSDPLAVLDPSSLKVKGFTNLRVVDCSSFPDIPAANTNLPAIMLAERAADLMFRE